MPTIASFLSDLVAAEGPAALAPALPEAFTLTHAGPYPLLRHVALPGSETGGELLIELTGVALGPLEIAQVKPDPDGGALEIVLSPATLTGRYELFGLESPAVDVDTGGGLMPLIAVAQAADDPTPTPTPSVTPQQFDYLMQANAQRDQLNTTSNGQTLVTNYDTYNDVYNDVFQSNASLRRRWAEHGATSQMMDYTSQALNSGAVVNPTADKRTFGTASVSYNCNAFKQALAVWGACYGSNHPDGLKAATAVTNFQAVLNNTGNSTKSTKPMTGADVFTTVATTPAPTSTQSAAGEEDEIHPLHDALTRYVAENHGATDLALFEAHDVTDEQLAIVREVYDAAQRVGDPKTRVPVQSGACHATCGATSFRFALTAQPNGAVTVKLVASSLTLAGLDFDDANWPGDAGQAARERVASAAFIRGILEDRFASQLTRLLRHLAARPV